MLRFFFLLLTGPLKASSDATAIEAALNLLPVIAPDTVSISTTAGATSNTFVITFNSALGQFNVNVYSVEIMINISSVGKKIMNV